MSYSYSLSFNGGNYGPYSSSAELCSFVASQYGATVHLATETACEWYLSGSPWASSSVNRTGTADASSPPASSPASSPSSSSSSSAGTTVSCGAACTVTVQHEIVFPSGDLAVAGMDAGSVVEVLGWGLGFVLLMYVLGMAAGAAVGLIRKI